LFVESGGLRQYPPREVIEHDSGLDQPERFPVRRGSIQHHSVLGISPSPHRARGEADSISTRDAGRTAPAVRLTGAPDTAEIASTMSASVIPSVRSLL